MNPAKVMVGCAKQASCVVTSHPWIDRAALRGMMGNIAEEAGISRKDAIYTKLPARPAGGIECVVDRVLCEQQDIRGLTP